MQRRCNHCKTSYTYQRSTSRHCSDRCRQAASRKRRKRNIHFRSDTSEWSTPRKLFAELHKEFRFTVDVCATKENAKCKRYFTREQDGLTQEWKGVCWCNPPYGRQIGRWICKAYESSRNGATVVCLIPSRTDTAWWHDYVLKASEIRYIRGCIKFQGVTNAAPFPSCIVIFK